MSKRALKKYLHELNKEQLEDQILDLYDRFKEVKAFYNFAFNPKEDKLMEEAKFKISREYFPLTRRRPKLRRSIAQKLIKQFITLGVEPHLTAEIMLYNIEIAQIYSRDKKVYQDSFYKSMLNSFEEAVLYVKNNHLENVYNERLFKIVDEAENQKWINWGVFSKLLNSSKSVDNEDVEIQFFNSDSEE